MKKLNEILGIKYPFIQGGMANIATGEFAAKVANAGALGIIGTGGMNGEQLKEHIKTARSITDKPFGVNVMLMSPFAEEIVKVTLEEGIKIITTGAGMPSKYMKDWKDNDTIVMPVTSSTVMAKRLVSEGADLIIAEGTESGGHVGEMTTMALVPQLVKAVEVPVVAAGGVASGQQLAAVFALGACGAQIGTCLLVSEECPIHADYKAAVIKAKDNHTVVTGRIAGTPVRIIKNQMAKEYVKREREGADIMELEKYTLGSLRRAVFEGDTKTGSLMAGQVCGQLEKIRPIAEILDEMYSQYKDVVKALSQGLEG